MTPEQLQQFNELIQFMNDMKNSTTIPFEVDGALRERLSGLAGMATSTKTASSEDQAVDEGGVATYNVLKSPGGFLQVTINGTTRYIPYYA